MLLVANISAAQAKNISATFFLNGEVFDQFAQEDVEITLEKFSATTCRLHLKNNLDFKFRPRVKVRFVENWGNKFEDKKTLPPVEVGKAIDFDIEMKNYSVTRRKNTTAWLQIWLDGDIRAVQNFFLNFVTFAVNHFNLCIQKIIRRQIFGFDFDFPRRKFQRIVAQLLKIVEVFDFDLPTCIVHVVIEVVSPSIYPRTIPEIFYFYAIFAANFQAFLFQEVENFLQAI